MSIIGIDLGTTNSLVSIWKDGESILIKNSFGEIMTPSVVSVDDNNEILVGKIAKERLITYPDRTASVFKRFIGTNKKYKLGKKEYLPEELSAYVLMQLKSDAERYLNETIDEAVISVPAYFDDKQRKATRIAGKLAGLKVERIINEPSAAALNCRMSGNKARVYEEVKSLIENTTFVDVKQSDDRVYIVFDFGGGTLDVSLVECFDNIINIVAVSGNNKLGGSDIDLAIVQEFCRCNNLNYNYLSELTRNIILKQAENSKIQLSELEQVEMVVNTDEIQGRLLLDKKYLIKIIGSILNLMIKPYQKVLFDSGTNINDVDEIILVGGTGKMPLVSEYLEYKTGKKVTSIVSPDTMVALGVGIYAGMKERNEEIKDMVLTDICPFSLGTQIYSELDDKLLMSAIIERNTILPCSKKQVYETIKDYQEKVDFQIFQGEERYAKDNICLGNIVVNIPPRPKGQKIIACFTYDINGILDIEITIVETGEVIRNIIVKDPEIPQNVLEEKKKEFEKIKNKENINEDSQYIKEWGNSLYAQTRGDIREAIDECLQKLEYIERNGTPLKIKQYRERIKGFFKFVENQIDNYGLVKETFQFDDGEE